LFMHARWVAAGNEAPEETGIIAPDNALTTAAANPAGIEAGCARMADRVAVTKPVLGRRRDAGQRGGCGAAEYGAAFRGASSRNRGAIGRCRWNSGNSDEPA
jgi:hypothetical protein